MKKFLELISIEVGNAFEACGYDRIHGKVNVSNRPDLCEYQCNGAMAAAKVYKKAPILIAQAVVEQLAENPVFAEVTAVNPGFINIIVDEAFLADYVGQMRGAEKHGIPVLEKETIVIDYGGANIAKPLHVGHLRPAVIGESVKRILRYAGHEVIGDAHLGDWGLQMGQIIEEVRDRQPQLCYFDPEYQGEYPAEPPFTISELEEIYPCGSAKSKSDEAFSKRAHETTVKLQTADPAYNALWNHILNVSMTDLKKNYSNLNVTFELWKKESDAQPYIPDMVKLLKEKNLAYISNGALVVDVQEETDTREIPPCIILKSDGGSLYQTTDLATIVEREMMFHPNRILYVTDKRQDLHFTQVFRVAKKAELVPAETELYFIGNGTMNGKDGKPFKTREGGVMRLEYLIEEINQAVYDKIMENRDTDEEEARETAKVVGLAALIYGDLSNQAAKDYIFDIERFTSFEGNSGPYILYTIVRIKSILKKYMEQNPGADFAAFALRTPQKESEKMLMLQLTAFSEMMSQATQEYAPHKVCAYAYAVADALNKFYHETKILSEQDADTQKSYIALIDYTSKVLEDCINLLGFEAPERM